MESTNVPMSKRLIGIALAAVFIVGSIFIPGSETLGHEGVMTLGLLLALVSLWVTSALPLGVTALFIIVMCPVLGIVGGLGQAIGGFASPALLAARYHVEDQLGYSSYWGSHQMDGIEFSQAGSGLYDCDHACLDNHV